MTCAPPLGGWTKVLCSSVLTVASRTQVITRWAFVLSIDCTLANSRMVSYALLWPRSSMLGVPPPPAPFAAWVTVYPHCIHLYEPSAGRGCAGSSNFACSVGFARLKPRKSGTGVRAKVDFSGAETQQPRGEEGRRGGRL